MRLRELVTLSLSMLILASSPEQLQALIDALAAYCATLQMEISVLRTKVVVVTAVPTPVPVVAFTCNGNPVEQVATFKVPGTSFASIRINCAPCHANQVEGWWFLGGCSAALQ